METPTVGVESSAERSVVRAVVARSALKVVDALPPERAAAVRARFDRAALDRITGTLPIGWVSMDDHYQFYATTGAVLTDAEFREFWKRTTLMAFEQPLLKAAWDSATRLLGVTPNSFIRWSPDVWQLITRGVGTMRAAPPGDTPRRRVLHWEGLPRQYSRSGLMARGMVSALHAFLVLSNATGTVTLIESDRDAGRHVYRFDWT